MWMLLALTITGGQFTSEQWDRCARFGGDGFSVDTCRSGGVVIPAWTGPTSYMLPIGLGSRWTLAQVGSDTCGTNGDCGQFTVSTFEALALPPLGWDRTQPFFSSVPFTVAGVLTVGLQRYDLIGQGTLTGLICLASTSPLCSSTSYRLTYQFSDLATDPAVAVPEGALPFGLIVLGLIAAHSHRSHAWKAANLMTRIRRKYLRPGWPQRGHHARFGLNLARSG